MKYLVRNALLALLVFVQMASAASLSPEQKDVTAFMEKMYSYGAGTFEFGRFNGHYDPKKFCDLMHDFFADWLLSPLVKNQGCDIGASVRYPGAGEEEMGYLAKKGQMPMPKLSIPLVEGNKARIEATSKYGKTIFFLIKTGKGLRVENALYYEKIPTEVNVCHGQFVKDPTPAQLKSRPACKDY